ncbi:hypothetical protein BBJ28_00018743 [Nothophytophthora sp. Chile5]|nr:hypothetical protein BBJ28_00018743 [Nothophytophthora sp. Chile5]
MELMSSSDDDADELTPPTSARPGKAESHRVATASGNGARRTSLSDELFTNFTGLDATDNQDSDVAGQYSVDRKRGDPVRTKKPVISARDLLMKFLPPGKQRMQLASQGKDAAKEAATAAAVAAYSFVTREEPNTSLIQQETLSAGERIARKYGLAAPSSVRYEDQKTHKKATAPVELSAVKTKKKSFWEKQIASVDGEQTASSKSTYVSPFRSEEEFMDMKRRRRRRQGLDAAELSAEDAKSAREAFYDDSKSDQVAVGRRPRHVIGSSIVALEQSPDDNADEWLFDAKEIVSDDEKDATNLIAPTEKRTELGEEGPNRCEERVTVRPRSPLVLSSSDGDAASSHEVCANLNSFLFDYQREGVHFLYSAYRRNTGAILGDDMGLGKTIQVIALLSAILKKCGDHRDKEVWRALRRQRRERLYAAGEDADESSVDFAGEAAPILIVVPDSLLHNWEAELRVWMSCCTVILHGKPEERETIIKQIARGEYEVIICSYDILKICLSELHKIPWEVVILDEMHCLKNPEAQLTKAVKAITCDKKLGLTGTLMQNNEKELHCLVDTIAPGALGSWQEFRVYYGNDIKYGRKKSAVPEALERSRQKEKELRRVLIPYYFRREKEINPSFQEVKKCDQVVFCDLTPYQLATYERILAMPEFELLRRGEEPCDCGRDSKRRRKQCCYQTPQSLGDSRALLWERFHPSGEACRSCPNCMGLVCVAQLLKLSNHMELLKVNPRDPPELQEYQADFAATALGEDADAVGGVQQVSNFQEMRAIGTKTCGKMLVLEKLLAVWKKRRQKTLLFSRSTRMLDIIQLFLISKAIAYSRLDGSTKVEERLQLVNNFNSKESNTSVFLISTKAGGMGLNLPSATNVVIFDPSWNPAHDCQAQDRAYRIGQTKDVQVYRLITLGTIEEMIYVRQIYKQQLSDTTLKGAKAPRYFEGVQGDRQQQGELFGIRNLLCWKAGGVLKGIQDAYQLSREGLMVQKNQVRYDTPAKKRAAEMATKKKKKAEPVDDEGEMIDIAGELVADVVVPEAEVEPSPPAASIEAKAVEEIDSDEDTTDFLLAGATTFRHEAIVGEQEGHFSYSQSDSDVEPELELPAAKKKRTDHANASATPLAGPVNGEVRTEEKASSKPQPRKDGNMVPVSSQTTRKRLYVPTYL